MTRRLIAVAALLTLTGCTLDKQTAPPLTGPSELGLSLAVTATPDIITQDGQSQATIQVVARDAASQIVSGLTVRADIYVNDQLTDFGTLSSKTVSTGGDGRATIIYRSPKAPTPLEADTTRVTISVSPVGSNYAATLPRTVDLLLVRPGVIVDPGAGPSASFFFSPTTPREDDDVFFDASASTGTVVSYTWSFGDGRSDTSSNPTTRHHFSVAGTYTVSLTVRDAVGRASTTQQSVRIASSADPTASFVISPSGLKAGDLAFFNASASKAAAGHFIAEYKWDFGDGTPVVTTGSALVNHAFAGSATTSVSYVVVLQVKDDIGRTATVSSSVTVAKPGP